MEPFPKNQFEAALKEPKKVRTQLAKFIKEYQAQNYHWIFQSLNILHEIMTSGAVPNVSIKLSAAFALKVLFDTAELAIINWIQIYFLPDLQLMISNCLSDGQASQYFSKIGYDKNIPDLTKYSFSYTKILCELLEVAAKLKPHRLYEAQQLGQQSQYCLLLKRLIEKGYRSSQKMSFFKQDAIKKVTQQFQNKLQNFNGQLYQEFFQLKLQEYLINGRNQRGLDILKVYYSGDLFATSSAIQICKDSLIQCNNINSMKNALILLNQLMISADYQTFYSLNNQNGLSTILKQIFDNKSGDYSLNRGKNLFKNAGQNLQQKQKFYILFLECLQRWSEFYPTDKDGKVSVLKSACTALKSQLQYPQNKKLKQNKQEFNKNKKKNFQRNKRLSSQIQHQIPEINTSLFKFPTINNLQQNISKQTTQKSKKDIQSQVKIQQPKEKLLSKKEIQKSSTSKQINESKHELLVQSREKETPHHSQKKLNQKEELSYKGIKQTIIFAKETLSNLPKDSQQYQTNLAILKQFVATIDTKLQNAQIEDQSQFNQITENAFTLCDEINKALQISKKYENKDQNFLKFSQELQSKVIKQKEVKSKQKIEQPSIKINIKDQQSITLNQKSKDKSQYTKQMLQQAKSNPKIQIKKQEQDTPVKRIRIDNQDEYSQINKSRQNFDNQSQIQSIKNQTKFSSIKHQEESKPEFILSQKKVQQHHPLHQNQNDHHSLKRTEKHQSMSQSRKSYKKIQNLQINEQSSIQNSRNHEVKPNFQQNNFKQHNYDFQNISPLEQDIESNVSAHKPKQFKSLGQYKFQSQSKIPGKQILKTEKPHIPADHELGLSNARSNLQKSSVNQYSPDRYKRGSNQIESSQRMKNSNASYQLNLEEQYNHQLLQDQMHVPDYQPLQQSFHDISEIQQKVKNNPTPSFKKCFEADKYVLPQDKKAKVYWLQNDTCNLLRPVSRKERLKSSKISVPQILQQRNKKYQAEMKQLQEEKNQKIKQLESKVKNLQTQTTSMKHKITLQDQQLRSMRSNSQYDKQSQGKRNYISDQQNIILNKFSLGTPSKIMTPQNKHFFDQSKTKSMFLDPSGKLIASKNYKTYFSQFVHQKQKKALLKNKQLLQKDKYLEIGSMGRREGQNLILIFYVTPEKDLEGLTWTIQNTGLQISCEPNQIPFIRGKKQEKIFLTIKIDQIPFKLPTISFYYKIQDQFLNQNINIPAGFHKFVHVKEVEDDIFNKYFANSEQIIRGEEVPYSRRTLKNYDILRQFFPNISLLNKGQPNTQGQISYGGLANYKNIAFPIKISIKPNQFLYVQSISQNKGLHNQSIVQFYLCLVTHLLMKEIQM